MKKLKVKSIDDSKQNFFFMHLIDILKLKKLSMQRRQCPIYNSEALGVLCESDLRISCF